MDALGLVLRAALVFALLGLTLWAVRRVDLGRVANRAGSPVQVLSTTRLGKGASLAVVRIGGAAYAVGVTEHAVSLLLPTDLPDLLPEAPAAPAGAAPQTPGFAAALQAQVQQLVRPRRAGADSPDSPVGSDADTSVPVGS